jgi:serine phosphatase RsbU (regulator of sigma subunit)
MPPSDPFEDDQTVTFRRPAGWTRSPSIEEPVHLLLLLDENGPPKRLPLRSLPVTIGRTEPADLVLAGGTVSRRHCRLELRQEQLVLSDLNSTNGTFVDDVRVESPTVLRDGVTIAVGAHRLRYHRRSLDESVDADAMDRELEEASSYVAAILPPPIESGPVRVDWFYQPSTRLAGDAFGYQMLDQRSFSVFLLDVAGHGTGAALHAVSVANVLRQGLLPDTDRRDPAAVLSSLNQMFPMERYNGLFFTLWYGVYDTIARSLRFASAGHHAGFLLPPPRRQPQPLSARNPAIGMLPAFPMTGAAIEVAPGSALFLFSDGAFEIVDRNGRQWGLDDILPLLPASPGPRALYDQVRQASRPGPLEDDFSALLLRFP